LPRSRRSRGHNDPHTNALLVAGTRSYEALAAVSEFRREIQTVMHASLKNDLARIADAMAIRLEEAEVRNYAGPDSFTKDFSRA
jgi:hypothetical protein